MTVTKMELPAVYFALSQDVWQQLLWLKEWQLKEKKRLARQLDIRSGWKAGTDDISSIQLIWYWNFVSNLVMRLFKLQCIWDAVQ